MDPGHLASLGPGMTPLLACLRQLLQRSAERRGVAHDFHTLDAGRCPTGDLDAARWDAERPGEHAAECGIRLALHRQRTHAYFHHRAPVGERLDPVDPVAAGLGREAYGDDNAAGAKRPGARHAAQITFG